MQNPIDDVTHFVGDNAAAGAGGLVIGGEVSWVVVQLTPLAIAV